MLMRVYKDGAFVKEEVTKVWKVGGEVRMTVRGESEKQQLTDAEIQTADGWKRAFVATADMDEYMRQQQGGKQ